MKVCYWKYYLNCYFIYVLYDVCRLYQLEVGRLFVT